MTEFRRFRLAAILFAAFVYLGSSDVSAQANDSRIDRIRNAYRQVNDQIAESEKSPEFASIFVIELEVNKHNAPYPAVGVFTSTARFYYTFGDREKNAYPDRLLKVVVTTRRAARAENAEYLYDPAGKLIFAFEKTDDAERRFYFDINKLIRYQEGQTVLAMNAPATRSAGSAILKESDRLSAIFRNAL
jgi:hypothetical protein